MPRELPVGQIRHVDVEHHRAPAAASTAQALGRVCAATRAALAKLRGLPGSTHSDTAIAGKPRNRPSTAAATVPEYKRVVAEIGAVVHARDDDVVLEIEQSRNRQMHAIGGRAVDVVSIGVVARRAHRHIERERIAGAAAVAVGSHDGDGAEGLDRPPKRVKPSAR